MTAWHVVLVVLGVHLADLLVLVLVVWVWASRRIARGEGRSLGQDMYRD